MDQSQVLGARIARIESWLADHPQTYDAIRRDELRTLYIILGDESRALEQSDVILANQFNEPKTLQLMSESKASFSDSKQASIDNLIAIATRYPQYRYVGAAARIRAGDLLSAEGKVKQARSMYRQAFAGPTEYARLARKKAGLSNISRVSHDDMHRSLK